VLIIHPRKNADELSFLDYPLSIELASMAFRNHFHSKPYEALQSAGAQSGNFVRSHVKHGVIALRTALVSRYE
jgi:hypothetical protein